MLVFNFAACVPVWISVGLFGWYHLWLASGNTTTIEKWEKEKVSTMVRRGKIKEIKYPYVSDLGGMGPHSPCSYKARPSAPSFLGTFMLTAQNLGTIANLKSVLGPNPLLWLWPQPQTSGDGLTYPITPDAGGESANEWAGAVAPDQTYPGTGAAINGEVHATSLQSRLRGHLRENDSMV